MGFKFMQRVKTPKGKGFFVGYIGDGLEAQVTRVAPATEFNRDDCIRRKPSLEDIPAEDFKAWQKSADFNVNEIYPVSQLEAV